MPFVLALWLACFDLILVDFSPVKVTLELKHPNVCVNLDRCVGIADPFRMTHRACRIFAKQINVLVRRDGDITLLFMVPAL